MVDLTAEEDEEMDDAPATPPPNVSDSDREEMETGDEDDLLAYTGEGHGGDDSSEDDGFQHV